MPACPSCGAAVLDIDVKCGKCGNPIGTTGAHRMLGTVVLGQYELVDVLGQGGMSVVYKGRHKLTDQGGKVMHPQGAKVTVKDGPYVESKEVVGGIYLIKADSYDHAVKLCQGHPNFRFGSIEVREIDFMGQPES